ncbi:DUF2793 domain-containing protein [Manganibacter manganicus]|nr:DUF2793 domain-containing protein [Pseudaminobacter manganicus]
MENSPNLHLPYIMPSQAQKHLTHNEALDVLDATVQLTVIDRDLTEPPDTNAEGDRYIVALSASGEWQGQDSRVAIWRDGAWQFLTAGIGWRAWIVDEEVLVYWSGSAWETCQSRITELQNLSRLGIGAKADAVNPFSAKLNTALWGARPVAEGGNGDLRYTMNKEDTPNTLSLLMQSHWSGRAEIGLISDENLTIKVSPDGATWMEALAIDRNTARISAPASNFLTDYAVNLFADSGRFAGNDARDISAASFVSPPYLQFLNGANVAGFGRYINNSSDYGGTAGPLVPEIKNLIDGIRAPSQRRYGVEFQVACVTMGAGSSYDPVISGGSTYFTCMTLSFGPRVPKMTFHCYLRALDAPIAYRAFPGQALIKNGVRSTGNILIDPADGWVSMTVEDAQNPYESNGYNPTPMTVHSRGEGDRLLLACPALMGGITSIDDNVGVIAGINRWLG